MMKNKKIHDFELNILKCKKCPKLVDSRKKIVKGYGNYDADIMFVGLAPGRNGADITGIPFTKDPSGVLFQECLIFSDLSLEKIPTVWKPELKNVFVTNLVKCNPKDIKGTNRDPSKEEITNCLEYLKLEKSKTNPKVIVLFGKKVTEIILDTKIKKFSDVHNVAIEKERFLYLPFFHPSYVIRGAYKREKYKQEFKTIKRFLTY